MRVLFALLAMLPVVFAGCGEVDWRDPVSRKVAIGNERMKEGAAGEALNAYRDAQIDAPDDERIHYNIGNALYRERKYEDAQTSWQRAAARGDTKLQARAAFNTGNAHFRNDRLDLAAESYQRALELDPADMDAKFNLELVQRLLSEAAQRAEQEQDQQQEQQERPQASQWARGRAREAEQLARQGYYDQAHQVMQRTLTAEPAAQAEFGDFAKRLEGLAGVFGGTQ